MQIGILMTTSPEHANAYTVGRLAEELLKGGHAVELFLMEDGVYHAALRQGARNPLYSNLQALMEEGGKVYLCAVTAEARGLRPEQCLAGVEFSSQYELSQMVERSDRFLAFN